MAVLPSGSPGHIDPILGLSPRLRRSPRRGRGGTCSATSEANSSNTCKTTASDFAEPGLAEVKNNNLDQDRPQLLRYIPESYCELAKNSPAGIY